MKKIFVGTVLLALFFVSGCIESTTMLDLNRDGSGKIVVREFMSPQITQMMEGMGNMFAGMEQAGEQGSSPKPEKADIFKDQIEDNVKKFGEGVKLVSSKKLKNKEGWKGYEAVYSFADINTITIPIGDVGDQGEGPGMGQGDSTESEDSGSDTVYNFKFSPGEPATLEIVPKVDETDADAEKAAESAEVAMEDMPEMEEGMDEMGAQMMQGMGAMMGPMLKGMRMTFMVRVADDIKDTNSAHKWPKRPNMITVMDMQVDKMLGNAKAMQLLQSQDEESIAKIEKMNIEGIKLEPPTKTISLTF